MRASGERADFTSGKPCCHRFATGPGHSRRREQEDGKEFRCTGSCAASFRTGPVPCGAGLRLQRAQGQYLGTAAISKVRRPGPGRVGAADAGGARARRRRRGPDRRAGMEGPPAGFCSAHMLEDQPMRYLRAAGVIARDPRQLRAQLRQLLGDTPDTWTDAEQARADALADTAAATSATACPEDAAGVDEPRADPHPSRLVLRTGTAADVLELVALHTRCSADTLYRRYHAPMSRLGPRMARRILQPAGGISLVLCDGDTIVAAGMLAAGDEASTSACWSKTAGSVAAWEPGSCTPWPVTPRGPATRPSPVWSTPTTTPCCAPWTGPPPAPTYAWSRTWFGTRSVSGTSPRTSMRTFTVPPSDPSP
jgi:hypothetical protein